MEPDINELKDLLAGVACTRAKNSEEGRAIELAVAAVEILRERGTVSGNDICRMAEVLGFERDAIARAWKTRAEFDLTATPYAIDAPIARVLRLL
jgi:hypothetical protein